MQGSSVQHQGQRLGGDPNFGVTFFIHQGLCYLGLLSSLLELGLLKEAAFPSFYHVMTLLIPHPFVISRVRLERLSRQRGRKLSLSSFLWHLTPRLRLHDL